LAGAAGATEGDGTMAVGEKGDSDATFHVPVLFSLWPEQESRVQCERPPHPTHCLRYNINSLKHFVGAEK
jgi:hypothetical protein